MKLQALIYLSTFISCTLISHFQYVSSSSFDVEKKQNLTTQKPQTSLMARLGFGYNNSTIDESGKRRTEEEDDEDEVDDELELEEDELDDETTADSNHLSKLESNERYISLSGQKIELGKDQTVLIIPTKARGLGLLTLKALILGPLIGLTIKAALFRGLIWAIGAYFLHLFFPSALSALGLGSGLVGFSRQLQQPSLVQLIIQNLAANYPNTAASIKPNHTNLKYN